MTMQLNTADVRLLIDGLKAWINEPKNNALLSVIARGMTIKDDADPRADKFGSIMMKERDEADAKRNGRAREVNSLIERLESRKQLQFTIAELQQMETGLHVYCEEPALEDLSTAVMRSMLFSVRSSDQERAERSQEAARMNQKRRLRVIPTAYKLVMAINAASEHEGVKC